MISDPIYYTGGISAEPILIISHHVDSILPCSFIGISQVVVIRIGEKVVQLNDANLTMALFRKLKRS